MGKNTMTIGDLIDEYHELENKICQYFGYAHSWRIFPIMDERDQYWFVVDERNVISHSKPFTNLLQIFYNTFTFLDWVELLLMTRCVIDNH